MGNNGSLVSLESLQGNMSDLTLGLAHEHLTRCGQHLLILALDLYLERKIREIVTFQKKKQQQAKHLGAVSASKQILDSKIFYNIAVKIFRPFECGKSDN